MAGPDPRDLGTQHLPPLPDRIDLSGGARGLRVGVPTMHYFDNVNPEIEAAVRAAIGTLESLGASIVEITIPDHDLLLEAIGPIYTHGLGYHRDFMRTRLSEYGADVQVRLLGRQLVTTTEYALGIRARELFAERYREAFKGVDLLAAPTTPVPAYRIEDVNEPSIEGGKIDSGPLAACTRPLNVVGLPAISVPAGFTSSGLPIGFQLVGRAYDEPTVLRAAAAYEAATDWHTRRPPLLD
jgi:aspartyl-tRNA(Asn)/glutamyl-tRNA(Gln) amidotransferase subunit A